MKAFPQAECCCFQKSDGMDLRDYFAAKAMQGMCANTNDDHNPFEYTYEDYVKEIAKNCYVIADAMMEARND